MREYSKHFHIAASIIVLEMNSHWRGKIMNGKLI